MNNIQQEFLEIIKEYINDASCGIFDSRNIVGDVMSTIYDDGNLQIDICYGYNYFEVFGLSDDEFEQLAEYYDGLLVSVKYAN